jgi:hypothetical protein
MRWSAAKIIPLLVAIGLVVLGIWFMFMGTDGAATAAVAGAPTQVDAVKPEQGNPAMLGLALIAGGVIVLFMSFRRV